MTIYNMVEAKILFRSAMPVKQIYVTQKRFIKPTIIA